jgi:phage-related protein
MTVPAEIILEKNKLYNTLPWLVLLDITLTDVLTLYLTNDVDELIFESRTYSPFPMGVNFVGQSIMGEIPEVNIDVSNVNREIQGWIEALNGAVDCDVVVRIVHKGNLTSDYSDFERHFKIMGTSCDNEWVHFSLGLKSPTQMRFPLFRTMGSHCNWPFKGIECGYSGSTESCDHTLKTCRLLTGIPRKIGYMGAKTFGGFPGLSESGVKFV